MAVIENDVIKVTVSSSSTKNVIKVSPGVAALSSVSLSLNELNDVDTTGITNGQTIVYENGSFVAGDAGAVKTVNDTNPDVDGNVNVSLSSLPDTSISNPADNDYLKYLNNRWVNDKIDISDVTGLQSSLDGKASTSSVPQSLSDLSDVTIVGTPAPNQALIFDGASGSFKSLPSFSNRFEDEAEINKQSIVPFVERVYTVKSDGDGIFIDPDPDTPSAGKVIKRNIYHKTGFLESGAVIGDFTLIHTFADDTAYSATVSTFEGFRDGNTYGTPPFTLIQTWEEVTAAPAFTGLLNEAYGSGAEAAYSTRRLNGNYSGDCMVIRRDSDGTTQSIGFVGEEIDESAIETFCTGTTCTVATWYDQSGNGYNVTQTTPTRQPKIYDGGIIFKRGRAMLDFTGTRYMIASTASDWNFLHDGTESTFASVVQFGANSADTAIHPLFGTTTTASGSPGFTVFSSNGAYRAQVRTDTGNVPLSLNAAGQVTEGSQALYFHYNDLTNATAADRAFAYKDGGANFANNTSTDGLYTGDADSPLYIGSLGSAQGSLILNGGVQELVFWASNKTANRTDIEGNISDYFQSAKLLDEQFGEGAEAAYSTRQLRRDQTDCMVIRRASDSTTTTIGFDANGDIDETAIETFCTGTTCTVVTWKDQSGNGNDATQSNSTLEPTVYTGGALVKENGRLAVFHQNNTLYAGNLANQTKTFFSVFKTEAAASAWFFNFDTDNTPALRSSIGASGFVDYVDNNSYSGDYLNGAFVSRILVRGQSFATQTQPNFKISGRNPNDGLSNPARASYQEILIFNSVKSAGDITSIESNIGDYFTQNTPLLDTYSGAAAAYSLRKLNSSYTGAAIEVYAGTNGTADIGFNVFGELDTVALAAHCGNQDGTVQTWYDQSGNGNHATQGNTGSQPKIYDGATTSVVTEGSAGNEKPAVEFDGTSSRMTSSMTVTSDFTTSVVLKALTASQSNQWLLQDTSGSDMLLRHRSTNYDFYDGTTTHIIGTAGTDQHHIFITANTSGSVVSFDGADQSISGILNNGYTDLEIGGDSGSRWWHGRFQEIVIYGSYEAANRAGIETNINTFYNIY